MHSLQLHDAAARRGIYEVADWYEHRVESNIFVSQELVY